MGLGPGSVYVLYDNCLNRCAATVSHPALWKARAELREMIRDYDAAIEFRRNQLKGLQVEDWQDSVETASGVLTAATSLVLCYNATGKPKHSTSRRLLVDGLVAKVESSDNINAEENIRALVQQLKQKAGLAVSSLATTSGGVATTTTTTTATTTTNEEKDDQQEGGGASSSNLPDYLSDWA